MNQITLPKNQYDQLLHQAKAYRKITANFFKYLISDSVSQTVEDFRKTDLYTEPFLKDLEDGLKKSSYAKTYGHKSS